MGRILDDLEKHYDPDLYLKNTQNRKSFYIKRLGYYPVILPRDVFDFSKNKLCEDWIKEYTKCIYEVCKYGEEIISRNKNLSFYETDKLIITHRVDTLLDNFIEDYPRDIRDLSKIDLKGFLRNSKESFIQNYNPEALRHANFKIGGYDRPFAVPDYNKTLKLLHEKNKVLGYERNIENTYCFNRLGKCLDKAKALKYIDSDFRLFSSYILKFSNLNLGIVKLDLTLFLCADREITRNISLLDKQFGLTTFEIPHIGFLSSVLKVAETIPLEFGFAYLLKSLWSKEPSNSKIFNFAKSVFNHPITKIVKGGLLTYHLADYLKNKDSYDIDLEKLE